MKRAWPWLLLIALAAAGAVLFLSRRNPLQTALESRRTATRALAEYLAARHPDARAVVVSNPFTQRRGLARGVYAQEQAGIRGLEDGFRGAIEIAAVVYPELTPEAQQDPASVAIDPSSPTPLSYLMAPGAFDTIAREHPDCQLLVSLVGVPLGLEHAQVWRHENPAKLALLFPDLRMIGGGRAAVRDALRSGKLAAFLLPEPRRAAEDPGAASSQGEAAAPGPGFILVTPETVDALLEADRGLLDFPGR